MTVLEKTKPISLSNIVLNEKIRCRVDYDQSYLNKLIKSYKSKFAVVPPVIVVTKKNKLLLADGYYRYYAAKKAGISKIEVIVRNGGEKEAAIISAKMNNHKNYHDVLKRSNKCKRKSVMVWMEFVDRRTSTKDLYSFLGICQPTIAKIRKKITDEERKRKNKKMQVKVSTKPRKRSSLPPEIKKEIADLKLEIELKYQRQWNVAVKEEILYRLEELYKWVENDLNQGDKNGNSC
jgi:hypothetical protein